MEKAINFFFLLCLIITATNAWSGSPPNIFSYVGPDSEQTTLENAVWQVVMDASADGMSAEQILSMAKENPLAEQGVATEELLILTLAVMLQSQSNSGESLRQALAGLGLSESLLDQAKNRAPLAGSRLSGATPVAPRPFAPYDGQPHNGHAPMEKPASPATF